MLLKRAKYYSPQTADLHVLCTRNFDLYLKTPASQAGQEGSIPFTRSNFSTWLSPHGTLRRPLCQKNKRDINVSGPEGARHLFAAVPIGEFHRLCYEYHDSQGKTCTVGGARTPGEPVAGPLEKTYTRQYLHKAGRCCSRRGLRLSEIGPSAS